MLFSLIGAFIVTLVFHDPILVIKTILVPPYFWHASDLLIISLPPSSLVWHFVLFTPHTIDVSTWCVVLFDLHKYKRPYLSIIGSSITHHSCCQKLISVSPDTNVEKSNNAFLTICMTVVK